MKNEFHGRRNRWSGFTGRSLITLVLVFCLIISTPFFSNAAESFDAKDCSLTVEAVNVDNEEFPGLADADLVVDLYMVAVAVAIPGSDGYTYRLLSPYDKLTITEDMNAEDWRALSQQAAALTFDVDAGTAKAGMKPAVTGASKAAIPNLKAGLYLLIARSDDTNYVTTTTAKDSEDAAEQIVTRATVGADSYLFLPELVSLPSKEAVDGVINTANPGDWLYDLTVYLKPEKDDTYGSLKIGKVLERYYVNGGPATFVFDVEAVLNNRVVYSNVVSMVFDDAGSQELIIENIPVGATVTVTEVYSGASYTVKSEGSKTTVITADLDDPASVEFDNDYDDRHRGGSGITNHFRYSKEEGRWIWDRVVNRSQG